MKKKVVWALLAFVTLSFCGCGKKALAPEESEPFETAIAVYLQQNSMGMKVAEFKSLTIIGDTATGIAAMQEAEGLYGLKVIWEFVFRKDNGRWKVVSYKRS